MSDGDRAPVSRADLEGLERPLVLGPLEFVHLHYTGLVQGWQGAAACGAPISQIFPASDLAETAATDRRREAASAALARQGHDDVGVMVVGLEDGGVLGVDQLGGQ